jgi:hypothetical protein
MLFDSEMRDGCNKSGIIGGMNNKLSSSSSRMRKKRNAKGYMNTDS